VLEIDVGNFVFGNANGGNNHQAQLLFSKKASKTTRKPACRWIPFRWTHFLCQITN